MIDSSEFIPVYQPSLLGNEKKYVLDCLESGWISSKGDYVNKFEEGFANRVGIRYANSVCNGTAALHLALLAAGIDKQAINTAVAKQVLAPNFITEL